MSNEDALQARDDQRHGVEPVSSPVMTAPDGAACWCTHTPEAHGIGVGVQSGTPCRQDGCRCVNYSPPMQAAGTEWVCKVHGTAKWVPAGVSKKTGKPYPAFRTCGQRLENGEWCPEAAPRKWPRKTPATVQQQVATTNAAGRSGVQRATQQVIDASKAASVAGIRACRAYQPIAHTDYSDPNGHCLECGQTLGQHPAPIETRVSSSRGGRGAGHKATRYAVTLTEVIPAHGRMTTLGFGWETIKPGVPVAVHIDETAGAAIRALLSDPDWEGGKVNAWVNEDDFVVSERLGEEAVRTMDNTLKTAVWTGDDFGLPGYKFTLVRGQGVVVLRTYQGDYPGDPLVQADVVYDPTDPKMADCQWAGKIISGVSVHSLAKMADWRTWVP